MIKEIKLPEIAENVTNGIVTSVLVSEGDSIEAEQDILEMETDKASVEVPAPFGGTVKEILVSDGDEISVGQAVMKVETEDAEESGDGDSRADEKPEKKASAEKSNEGEESRTEEDRTTEDRTQGDQIKEGKPDAPEREEDDQDREPAPEPAEGPSGASDVPASPATRRLARELGVNITEVSGSGLGGRVSADDVKAHARESAGGARRSERAPGRSASAESGDHRESMTRIRSLTAERTAESWATIPHVTQHEEVDLTELNAFMKRVAPKVEKAGGKLTVTAVLVKLVAQALRVYPRFNASADIDAGEIVYHDRIAIGIAADTDRGLLVPVIRDPDRKGITAIALEIGELAAQARSGELEPAQMQGATFSVSNLGGIGGMGFTPIIVPPAVAILGVARAKTQPVYNGTSFEPREILPLSLSYDHRVIDGADGARFVVWLKTAIEDPFAAFMEGGR